VGKLAAALFRDIRLPTWHIFKRPIQDVKSLDLVGICLRIHLRVQGRLSLLDSHDSLNPFDQSSRRYRDRLPNSV
jgi:hypothetical protein